MNQSPSPVSKALVKSLPRDEQRRLIVERIDRDREAMVSAVHGLRRPLHKVEHWQQQTRRVLPVVPVVVAAVGVAWMLLKIFRSRPSRKTAVPAKVEASFTTQVLGSG